MAVSRAPSSRAKGETTTKPQQIIPKPDRLFACIGKGSQGVITEFRHGVEARIGLHFDCEVPIIQAWPLPFDSVGVSPLGGTLFLLSIGTSSLALRLTGDEDDVEVIGSDMVKLSLDAHTIAADVVEDVVIQVTELAVIVASKNNR